MTDRGKNFALPEGRTASRDDIKRGGVVARCKVGFEVDDFAYLRWLAELNGCSLSAVIRSCVRDARERDITDPDPDQRFDPRSFWQSPFAAGILSQAGD